MGEQLEVGSEIWGRGNGKWGGCWKTRSEIWGGTGMWGGAMGYEGNAGILGGSGRWGEGIWGHRDALLPPPPLTAPPLLSLSVSLSLSAVSP